jgi:16S rRNA (uracil1498-N3)-methyltransferase
MNLILFEPDEAAGETALLAASDPRAIHVLKVLRRGPGESFDAGLIDGAKGKATIEAVEDGALRLSFAWGETPPPLDPITLVIGLPRPQTARRVLREASALGVAAMHFVATDLGEPGYVSSPLWTTQEWRRHVLDGAQQAFDTHLPAVRWGRPLAESLREAPRGGARFALDNYEAAAPLGTAPVVAPVLVALGPERGWSVREREVLRVEGCDFVHLGTRVLRVETACVAALALVRARLGLM